MRIDFGLFTDEGDRDKNEDSVRVGEKDGAKCFVLCDGLGGHGKGELASAFVSDYVKEYFLSCTDVDSFFEDVLDKAQEGLMNEQRRLGAQFEMKTTATILVIYGNKYRIAHIGDSRVYHFRKYKMLSRTLDHSVPQMLALAGDIKEKQIRSHPDRNRLLRVMGVAWDSPRYELADEGELKNGDAFLLCSDGFWEPITEKEMCKALKKASGAHAWLDSMQQTVRKNGEGTNMDNFSAIAVICTDN